MAMSLPTKQQPPHFFTEEQRDIPVGGSKEESLRFDSIQQDFINQFTSLFPDYLAPKTIIVIPSLTLDQEVLAKVEGAMYYEERMLCLLMLLRMPRTHVTFVSSHPIDPVIIDYYLHLLPGITGFHARERLTLLHCNDASPISLTEKILKRSRLIDRIRKSIPSGHAAHIACFNTTELEKTLSVKLGVPIFGCNPALNYLGSKSGSRKCFHQAGIPTPEGFEDLHSLTEIAHALTLLKTNHPEIRKAVVKLNDGFSGDGNAVFTYPQGISIENLSDWMKLNLLTTIKPVAPELLPNIFLEKFSSMGGIVEMFIEGDIKTSPSVQCRINPSGEIDVISTHDQVLGGECNQVFIGAHFPADEQYRKGIADMGIKIAEILKKEGVIGRFSIDFISVKENNQWKHHAIEINLRKGGTTHPFLMMQFLTNGHYDEKTGHFVTPQQQVRCYFASDNVKQESYKGLSPQDLIDIAMFHGLHFDGATQKGVMFHMIGALSQFGKMGMVCIGGSVQEAYSLYEKTIAVLDMETSIH